jgi:hypothetical protein
MLIRLFFLLFYLFQIYMPWKNCKWDNRKGIPCLTISKTQTLPNIKLKI